MTPRVEQDPQLPLERSLPQRSYTDEAEFARERDPVLFRRLVLRRPGRQPGRPR